MKRKVRQTVAVVKLNDREYAGLRDLARREILPMTTVVRRLIVRELRAGRTADGDAA